MGMEFVLCVFSAPCLYYLYKFLLSQGLYIMSVLYSKVLTIQPKWDYQKCCVTSNRYAAKQIVLLMKVHSEVQISFINDYSTG
jgi:hypothetical protein